jgi:hypothetical protein
VAKDGDMEASINAVPTGARAARWREPAPAAPAPAREPAPTAAAAPAGPSVELSTWFDRNGDGHIDTTPSVYGGDAFLPVEKHVSELLDHSVTRPRDALAAANRLASNAYRKYGAKPIER